METELELLAETWGRTQSATVASNPSEFRLFGNDGDAIRHACRGGRMENVLRKLHDHSTGLIRFTIQPEFIYSICQSSNDLSKNHAVVFVEDLSIRNMSKSESGSQENHGKNVKQKSGLNREARRNSLPSGRGGSQEMAETPAVLFHASPALPPGSRSGSFSSLRTNSADPFAVHARFGRNLDGTHTLDVFYVSGSSLNLPRGSGADSG